MNAPAKVGILVGRGHERACGLEQRFGAEPGTVLQHHLEAPRAAEALHGGGGIVRTLASLMTERRLRRSASTVFAVTPRSS